MTVSYSGNVITEWDASIGKFIIYRSFVCIWSRPLIKPIEFEIEEGFQTDFASIPRWARSIVPVVGKHIQPAVVHDWTYEKTVFGVEEKIDADTLFLEGMIYKNVIWPRRNIMYRSVRLGGTGRWN